MSMQVILFPFSAGGAGGSVGALALTRTEQGRLVVCLPDCSLKHRDHKDFWLGLEAGAAKPEGSMLECVSLCASCLLFRVSKMSLNYLWGRV